MKKTTSSLLFVGRLTTLSLLFGLSISPAKSEERKGSSAQENPRVNPAKEDGADNIELPLLITINDMGQSVEVVNITTDNNPKILFFYTDSILAIFKKNLIPDRYSEISKKIRKKTKFNPEDLADFKIKSEYNQYGDVSISVPAEYLKNEAIFFDKNSKSGLVPNSLPEKISGQIVLNGQINHQELSDKTTNDAYLTADLSLNTHKIVTTSGVKKNEFGYHLKDTQLSYRPSKCYSMSIGDLSILGDYSTQISGAGFSYSTDPDEKKISLMSKTIEIKSLSNVNIYKDEQLIKSTRANPGALPISDLPIGVGNNSIRVEIIDVVTGEKQEQRISNFIPIFGLREKEYSFSFAIGKERSEDQFGDLKYSNQASSLLNLEYGLTNWLASGLRRLKNEMRETTDVSQTIQLNNFSMKLNESRTISKDLDRNDYQISITKSNDMPLISNLSLIAAKTESESKANNADMSFSANATFKQFFGANSYLSYYMNKKTNSVTSESLHGSISSVLYSKKKFNLVGTISGNSYKSDKQPDNLELKLSFNYFDSTDSGRVDVSGNANNRSNAIRIALKEDDIDAAATSTNSGQTYNSMSLGKSGYLGNILGSYSATNESASWMLTGNTAFYFAGKSIGIGKPSSGSFLIFENDGAKDDFGVIGEMGNLVAKSTILNSAVVPVSDFSISSHNALTENYQEVSIGSSRGFVHSSGYRTGGAVSFSNERKILVVARVFKDKETPLRLTEIAVDCALNGIQKTIEVSSSEDSEISFSATKGSVCRIRAGDLGSDRIYFDFDSSFKDLGDILTKRLEINVAP